MFAVKWSSSASADVVECLMLHPDRADDIDEASEEIHDQLLRDPTGTGQHLSEGLWRLASKPLAAFFSIDANESYRDSSSLDRLISLRQQHIIRLRQVEPEGHDAVFRGERQVAGTRRQESRLKIRPPGIAALSLGLGRVT